MTFTIKRIPKNQSICEDFRSINRRENCYSSDAVSLSERLLESLKTILLVRYDASREILQGGNTMGKQVESIREFYNSVAWQNCREAYKKSVGGLCEECLKMGIISPADEVHHIKRLTIHNIKNPKITTDPENLQALCKMHHDKKHKQRKTRRYIVDDYGRVTPNPDWKP